MIELTAEEMKLIRFATDITLKEYIILTKNQVFKCLSVTEKQEANDILELFNLPKEPNTILNIPIFLNMLKTFSAIDKLNQFIGILSKINRVSIIFI